MKYTKQIIIFLISLSLTAGNALACSPAYPVDVYETYRLKRSLEYIFFDDNKDYYAYLLGDKLDPVTFYIAYRNWQGKPLSDKQIGDIEPIFKNNGNYYGKKKKYSKWNPLVTWYDEDHPSVDELLKIWNGEKNNITRTSVPEDDYWVDEKNCGYGVFQNAIEILQDKKKTLIDVELKKWVINQDEIFKTCLYVRDKNWNYHKAFQVNCDSRTGSSFWEKAKNLFFDFFIVKKRFISNKKVFFFDGSKEFLMDQEYQKASCYLYDGELDKATKSFQDIISNEKHPRRIDARLAYVRALNRSSDYNDENNLGIIEGYINDNDLEKLRDAFLLEKEKLLGKKFNGEQFKKAEVDLNAEEPAMLIHNMAIFNEQFELLFDDRNTDLREKFVEDDYSEFIQYLYYWNLPQYDEKIIDEIKEAYGESLQKDLWLVLLLKKADASDYRLGNSFVQEALDTNIDSQYYYPSVYYAYKLLFKSITDDKIWNSMVNIVNSADIPDIAYNYFSDLATKNADSLSDAIRYIERKSNFLAFRYGAYSFFRMKDMALGDAMNRAGYSYYKFRNSGIEKPKDDVFLEFVNFGLTIDQLYSNKYLREDYPEKIFTRAFLLKRKDIYLALLDQIAKKDNYMTEAQNANEDISRNFLIVYSLLKDYKINTGDVYGVTLHNRNFNYYDNMDDWNDNSCDYCMRPEDYWEQNKSALDWWEEDAKTEELNKKFMSEKEVEKNLREKKILFNESLIKLMAEPIFAYEKMNPGDSRTPEALSLLTWFRKLHPREDGEWPKKVFQHLKYNYPNSRWSKKTEYYY
ncbi:MAG: hypothetical protein A2288_02960 [Candidatus Moranbacteria bacterium RIFOXYA12_FULL_44_15]|nr:MAG: hypothetical protein A2288_02960 [Candidatus Moranbacteria bacterium RIFOXYA12_FULL_44_15]OGI36327.1 MAG: hypothetical protein A2259_00140 [Candidatus Moranbacteria bacterium RIFOXYA2_FULL_43_15]